MLMYWSSLRYVFRRTLKLSQASSNAESSSCKKDGKGYKLPA